MRRLITGFLFAAIVAIPAMALAGNQEIADQIAQRLRKSGQLSNYKVAVKYQDGTAWVEGRVTSPEQKKTALRLVFQIASVDRVVDGLKVVPVDASALTQTEPTQPDEIADQQTSDNPLRESGDESAANDRPVKASFLQRLAAATSHRSARPMAQPAATQEEEPAEAAEPSSPVKATSAEDTQEPQELPNTLTAPRHVAPVRTTHQPARMASQPVRGPAAYGNPLPMYTAAANPAGVAPARYDQPCMPNYAWPSYAAYPNYAAVTYPKQYSPTAWPYIGPFYPYPQVPLGWRKVTLEWDSGWWYLEFKDQPASCWHR
jgi:hypothetical protein